MSTLTIGKKLYSGIAILIVLALSLGLTAYLSLTSVTGLVLNLTGPIAHKQMLTSQLNVENEEMLSLTRGIIVRGFMKDTAAITTYQAAFLKDVEQTQADSDELAPLLVLPECKRSLQALIESTPALLETEQAMSKAALAGDMENAFAIQKQTLGLQSSRKTLINVIVQAQVKLSQEAAKAAVDDIGTARAILGGLLCLALLISIVMAITVRQIMTLLKHSIEEIASASEQIAASANQVSATSQSLAAGSSQQAASIEETSSASSEVNSMAQRTTASSKETAEIVTRSQKGIQETKQSLDQMVLAMEDINSSSQKISKIIKVIDEIAFQTNILALNAAVEAARAGEAGMGFAVVAEEVRNLAQRCAQAAKDTTDLIDNSIGKSAGGKVRVDQVAIAIRAMTSESANIKTLVDEISLGSIEQSRGIDQITQAITQMEQVTQTTAASAEESAAAAAQMNEQAHSLQRVIGDLRQMVNGPASASLQRLSPAPDLSRVRRVATFQSAVTFPPRKQNAVNVRLQEKPAERPTSFAHATSVAEFPLDDDFKEF